MLQTKPMKFIIRTNGMTIDFPLIEQALFDADPAAIIDIDKTDLSLRVSSCLNDTELLALMTSSGFPVPAKNVEGVPSECCGGCGG